MGELVVSDHGRAAQFLRSFDCSPALEGHGDNKVVICIDSTDSMIVAGYGNNVVERQRPYYHKNAVSPTVWRGYGRNHLFEERHGFKYSLLRCL